mmetsp:Transcript_27293/g.63882  ORF Transcript_27293/g.63882 Transcript_27293/m.63882 type:complete len:203 (-) Transcript_27293:32-640(-)
MVVALDSSAFVGRSSRARCRDDNLGGGTADDDSRSELTTLRAFSAARRYDDRAEPALRSDTVPSSRPPPQPTNRPALLPALSLAAMSMSSGRSKVSRRTNVSSPSVSSSSSSSSSSGMVGMTPHPIIRATLTGDSEGVAVVVEAAMSATSATVEGGMAPVPTLRTALTGESTVVVAIVVVLAASPYRGRPMPKRLTTSSQAS